MQHTGDKDQRMARYLLGELPAEERQSIEEQSFRDDQFFKELLIIEAELIDDYVRGELPVEERRKFEAHILSTQHGRQKVELSRAIMSAIMESPSALVQATAPEARTSWWKSLWQRLRGQNMALQLSFAAAVSFLVLGGVWLVVENMRLRSQLGSTQASLQQKDKELQQLRERAAAEQQRQQQQEAEWRQNTQQLNGALQQKQLELEGAEQLAQILREGERKRNLQQGDSAPRKAPASIATYIFPLNPVRGTGQQDKPLIISSDQKAIRFRIDLGRTDYPGYHVSLQSVEGDEVWGRTVKKIPSSTYLTLVLPTNILTRQDYILIVTPSPANAGTESIAEYSFRVVRKN